MKYCLVKLSLILIFGSLGVYVMYTIDLDKRTSLVIEVENGWRLYDLDAKEYFESRDVVFCKNELPFLTNVSNAQDDYNPSTQVLWNNGPHFIDESRMGMHDKKGEQKH
ncbi:hypothetical protein CR513_54757, partial [Mucuna pruriens]